MTNISFDLTVLEFFASSLAVIAMPAVGVADLDGHLLKGLVMRKLIEGSLWVVSWSALFYFFYFLMGL